MDELAIDPVLTYAISYNLLNEDCNSSTDNFKQDDEMPCYNSNKSYNTDDDSFNSGMNSLQLTPENDFRSKEEESFHSKKENICFNENLDKQSFKYLCNDHPLYLARQNADFYARVKDASFSDYSSSPSLIDDNYLILSDDAIQDCFSNEEQFRHASRTCENKIECNNFDLTSLPRRFSHLEGRRRLERKKSIRFDHNSDKVIMPIDNETMNHFQFPHKNETNKFLPIRSMINQKAFSDDPESLNYLGISVVSKKLENNVNSNVNLINKKHLSILNINSQLTDISMSPPRSTVINENMNYFKCSSPSHISKIDTEKQVVTQMSQRCSSKRQEGKDRRIYLANANDHFFYTTNPSMHYSNFKKISGHPETLLNFISEKDHQIKTKQNASLKRIQKSTSPSNPNSCYTSLRRKGEIISNLDRRLNSKASASSSSVGRRRHLLNFILELLSQEQSCVEWVNRSERIFQIVNPEMLTNLWGGYKNNNRMTFESLSRSLRLYYAPGKLERIQGLRHHYRLLYPSLNSEPDQDNVSTSIATSQIFSNSMFR